MISVTEKAVQKFKEFSDHNNKIIRINFSGIGCAGTVLYLNLDEIRHDNDMVVETNGVILVYNAGLENDLKNTELEGILQNFVLDYIDEGFNQGFFIKEAHSSSD